MFDTNALMAIISAYKNDFERIHKDESYKWKAVKCFQDNSSLSPMLCVGERRQR